MRFIYRYFKLERKIIMKNYKLSATEFYTDYCGANYAVVKILQDVEGVREQTTHYFRDEDEAQDKFLAIVTKEANHIRRKSNRAGYNTDNIVEVEALTNDEVLDAYGTYDTQSGNLITQVLLMRNPETNVA